MNPGDKVLFYRQGRYVAVASVVSRVRDRALARDLWGVNQAGQTWECVYFLDGIIEIDVEKSVVNDALGYQAAFLPQSLERPGPNAIQTVSTGFGSVQAFIGELTGLEDVDSETEDVEADLEEAGLQALLEQLESLSREDRDRQLDAVISSEGRKGPARAKEVRSHTFERSYKLAAALREKFGNRCKICSTTFRKRDGGLYSETHHVLPLGKGGIDTAENIVVVCPTCHRKFHSGSDGVIEELAKALPPHQRAELDEYLKLRR